MGFHLVCRGTYQFMLDMSRIKGLKGAWRWCFVRGFEIILIVVSGFYILLSVWRTIFG